MTQIFALSELRDDCYYIQYENRGIKELALSMSSVDIFGNTSDITMFIADNIIRLSITREYGDAKVFKRAGGFTTMKLSEVGDNPTHNYSIFKLDYSEVERHIIMETI